MGRRRAVLVGAFDRERAGRKYKGCCVLLDPVIHEIVEVRMKGFRGYRYFTAPGCEKT